MRNEYKTKDDFYKWVRERLVPIFAGATCGNGKCEPPGEYAGVGRFGCEQDCGKQPNVSTVVVSLAASCPLSPSPSPPLNPKP